MVQYDDKNFATNNIKGNTQQKLKKEGNVVRAPAPVLSHHGLAHLCPVTKDLCARVQVQHPLQHSLHKTKTCNLCTAKARGHAAHDEQQYITANVLGLWMILL